MHMIKTQYLLLACLAGLTSSGIAETLRDPTMPPAQLLQKAESSAESVSGPVLQSTKLVQTSKLGETSNAVMISGEMVSLGQKFHGAKLVKVTENTAVLRDTDGKQQILTMNYPIERKWRLDDASANSMGVQKTKNAKTNNQALGGKNDE